MEALELSQINKILENWRKFSIVQDDKPKNYNEEKSQGGYSRRTEVTKTSIPDLFLEIEYQNNSYGESELINKFQFVKSKEVTITQYVTI